MHPTNATKVKDLNVSSVEDHLQAMGKSQKSFGLGHLQTTAATILRVTKDICDALNQEIPPKFLQYKQMLNEEQQYAFTRVMSCVTNGQPGVFFIDGPGGTGKKFLYHTLFAEVRLLKKIVLPTATSGIAAANMPNGRTAHSRFKIPIDNESSLACDVPKQGSLAALLKETKLIIWDEDSMANKSNIESLDLLLQDLCENTELFGGKLVLFGGDFRQVLPIVPLKTQKEAVQASIVSSNMWPHFKKIHLTQNQLAREDPAFNLFLLSLGNDSLQKSESAFVNLRPQIIRHMDVDGDPVWDLINHTFPEIFTGSVPSSIFSSWTILSPLNVDVDVDVINSFPGQEVVYKNFDVILNDTCSIYPIKFINTLCPGGMSPHELILKPGCPVMLIRNLLPLSGLCNGTRLICQAFRPNVIEYVISVGQYMGHHVFIPRINLRPSSSDKYPFQFQREQFPLKLTFAMTINKS